MLVVLASQFDRASASLVERWGNGDARLMTPRDLSRGGWRDVSGGPPGTPPDREGRAVIAGSVTPTSALRGVLVRLPAVIPQELMHVVESDREYVAAEMTAFLVSWLSRLECPVLNRPTPACLMGPSWRREQWTHVARELGIRAHDTRDPVEPVRSTIVVGERCHGDRDQTLDDAALRLARAAGVGLLQLDFAGVALVAASLHPPLDAPGVADAVREHLEQHAA